MVITDKLNLKEYYWLLKFFIELFCLVSVFDLVDKNSQNPDGCKLWLLKKKYLKKAMMGEKTINNNH